VPDGVPGLRRPARTGTPGSMQLQRTSESRWRLPIARLLLVSWMTKAAAPRLARSRDDSLS